MAKKKNKGKKSKQNTDSKKSNESIVQETEEVASKPGPDISFFSFDVFDVTMLGLIIFHVLI